MAAKGVSRNSKEGTAATRKQGVSHRDVSAQRSAEKTPPKPEAEVQKSIVLQKSNALNIERLRHKNKLKGED